VTVSPLDVASRFSSLLLGSVLRYRSKRPLGLSTQTWTSIIWLSGVRFRPASFLLFLQPPPPTTSPPGITSHVSLRPMQKATARGLPSTGRRSCHLRHQIMRGGSASVNAMALIYTEHLELSCVSAVVQQSAHDIGASQTQDIGLAHSETTFCLQS
jgi:hypothetical protein